MEEYVYQDMIKLHYSGGMTEAEAYTGLALQTVAILAGGIILWRASAYMHNRKKKQRKRNDYFETPYSQGWKRK